MTGTIPPLPARIGQRSIVASKGTWWSKFRIDKLHRPWGGMENKVNERRTRAKISAGELAVRAGMFGHDTLRIESHFTLPSIQQVQRISVALGLPVESIFPGSGAVLVGLELEYKLLGRPSMETYEQLRSVGIDADTKY